MRLEIIGLFALAFLAACETTPITPTTSMNPALAERLAVLNTDEPMPPAEGPEDVALFGGVNDALTIAAIF
jgi:hypothetical protein